MILPRQARDKHRENFKKKSVSSSAFVHSNDDAVAVKATMPAPAMNTERIVVTHAVFSTKKSCLKVGTESLRNFSDILFR
jgi:polygalacturonase